jgi:DNA repair protein RadA/Sms
LQRIAEAEKLGFKTIVIPNANMNGLDAKKFKIEIRPVCKVEEALRFLFG